MVHEITSTEVPVSGDGTIKRVGLSWGVREAESQRARESESQGVPRVSLSTEVPVSSDGTIKRVSLSWGVS